MKEQMVRVAVLGQGRSGCGIHVKWLRQDERFKVVAVADLLPDRHDVATEIGAKGYGDFRELLRDRALEIDLIVNALPSDLHPAGTIAALESGRHVMTEKPAAVRVADLDRMIDAAKKNDRRLMFFQNSRFNPAFVKLREVLDSGKLGKLIHARISYSGFARRWDWQASQQHWGGNLNNTGPHPLDMAVVLFGDRTPSVFAKLISSNPFGDADNFATISLHGADSPLVEVLVSSFLAYPQGDQFNLSCTRGGLAGNTSQLRWKYFEPDAAPQRKSMAHEWSEQRTYNSEKLPWVEESWSDTSGDELFHQLSRGIYDNVYDVLVNGAEPVVTQDQVRRQIAVLEECHRQNPLKKQR